MEVDTELLFNVFAARNAPIIETARADFLAAVPGFPYGHVCFLQELVLVAVGEHEAMAVLTQCGEFIVHELCITFGI